MRFRAKIRKYSHGAWAIGMTLVHVDREVVLYIKLFKWYLTVGYMNEDWV